MKNMMVRKCAVLAALLCATLQFSGCKSIARSISRELSAGKFTYGESVSPEQSALVVFTEMIRVTSYNGTDIDRRVWYPKVKTRINKVTLPAGATSIHVDLHCDITRGYILYRINRNDMELRFKLEAGKEYTVSVYLKKKGFLGLEGLEFGVGIWEYASTNPGNPKKMIESWKLGDL
ncbi:MAG: hypothetical protein LBL44_09585 [Treponema sp.]|nr:hypothetical protein [Treponema sp.]